MFVRATFLGIFLGFIATLCLMQHDPTIQERIGKAFKDLFEKSVGCHMQGTVASLSIVQPSLTLSNVRVTPACAQEQWWWQAERLIVACSWWHLFCYGIIDLHVTLEKADIYTALNDGTLAINHHLATLLFGPSSTIPLCTKSVIYKQAHMHTADTHNGVDVHLFWNSESKKIDTHFKTTLYCTDGTITRNGTLYINQLHGTMYADLFSNGQETLYAIKADAAALCMPQSPLSTPIHVTAWWDHGQGALHALSTDHALKLGCTASSKNDAHAELTIPVSYLVPIVAPDLSTTVTGSIVSDAHIMQSDNQWLIEGNWTLHNGSYNGMSLGTAAGSCTSTPDAWHGLLTWHLSPTVELEGSWYWNQEQAQITGALHEKEPVSCMGHWYLQPGTTRATLTYNDAGIISSYATTIVNRYDDTTVHLAGTGSYAEGVYALNGSLNGRTYSARFTRDAASCNGSCIYYDNQSPLATLTVQNKTISGSVDVACIKELLAAVQGGDLHGQGIVHWTLADYQQLPLIISCRLEHGTLRIPNTYNAIHDLRGTIEWDYKEKKLSICTVQCALYQGSLACNRATCFYDAAWRPEFIHAPWIIDGCLLTMDKDLCALVSGHVTYTQKKDDAQLAGLLTIDQAQLKENILSNRWVHHLLTSPGMMFPISSNRVGCSMLLKTVTPAHIKTPFLDTTAAIDLHIANTLAAPEVVGSITFGSGSLSFPYKPLYITQGALYFVPGHTYDPVIEWSAKNSIKNHAISLQVTGSLAKPHVALESWPPLTQEQIVSLLLVGSYQDSLNMVMPALLMNNITTLLFGDTHAPSPLTHTFARVLEPFKRIKFVPSFTDQTGRGGLRGAIEIDVSDRVHAVIQKNFSLTEDTYFELGYLLSDEINVRLLRDERRDMGAEIEMRWKFGG